jgi:hypothetical protein
METTILIFALIMLVTGILTIATTSIGLECYTYTGMNKGDNRTGNMWFMAVTLFCAILLTLAAFPAFYMGFTM